MDGLSHKEIGDLLGINPHSSSSQLARAKKMLRVILIKYWMLFLLPILIPVYIYFVRRDKFADTSDNSSTALDTHHNFPKRVQQNGAASQRMGSQGILYLQALLKMIDVFWQKRLFLLRYFFTDHNRQC